MGRLTAAVLSAALAILPAVGFPKPIKPDQIPAKIFSKWHENTCELVGRKLKLIIDKIEVDTEFPEHKGEPLDVYCSQDTVNVLYSDGISMYGAPREVMLSVKGMTEAPFQETAVAGMFIREGDEALVVFEDGSVKNVVLTKDRGYEVYSIKNPDIKDKPVTVSIEKIGEDMYTVIFPQTESCIIFSGHCGKELEAYSISLPSDAILNCPSADNCSITDGRGNTIEQRELNCP